MRFHFSLLSVTIVLAALHGTASAATLVAGAVLPVAPPYYDPPLLQSAYLTYQHAQHQQLAADCPTAARQLSTEGWVDIQTVSAHYTAPHQLLVTTPRHQQIQITGVTLSEKDQPGLNAQVDKNTFWFVNIFKEGQGLKLRIYLAEDADNCPIVLEKVFD